MSGAVWPKWFLILTGILYCLPILVGLGLVAFFIWWYPVSWASVACAIATVIYATRLVKKMRD